MTQDSTSITVKTTLAVADAKRAAIECLQAVVAIADEATRLFRTVPSPDKKSWDRDYGDEAVDVFQRALMESNIELKDHRSYIIDLYRALRTAGTPSAGSGLDWWNLRIAGGLPMGPRRLLVGCGDIIGSNMLSEP